MTGSVLVFDGDCGFCTASVEWLRRRVPTRVRYVPWQRVDLAEMGLTRERCEEAVQWIGATGRRGAGPVAVGYVLSESTYFWKPLGWLLVHAPVRWLAWPVYRWIARHRHQLPGGTAACAVNFTDGDRRAEAAAAE